MSQTPIITLSDEGLQSESWQWYLRNVVTDASQLMQMLDLTPEVATTDFPLRVPLPYIERMQRGNPDDPLLKQVLPTGHENLSSSGYVTDPLNEKNFVQETRGIIQKYDGRVLLLATGACAVHCRYCFRRHFPYDTHQARNSDLNPLVEAIAADSSISEVIFSGGDPLVLSDNRLANLTAAIDAIAHVRTIRFHTRVPVVIPQRICRDLLTWIDGLTSQVVFVLHINHANEVDDKLRESLLELRNRPNITLLNQAVLLKDINDSKEALESLSRQLFSSGVLPYYLHLLDPVSGAEHFDVPEAEGIRLVREISGRLPGYLVPKLVREVPGESSKHLIPLD